MKTSTITAKFTSPIEVVWNLVTNNKKFDWRSDISNIIVSDDGKSFYEITNKGFKTEFIITTKNQFQRYEFDIKNKNMVGHWIGIFSKDGLGTKVEFIEEVKVSNPIMNLFVGSYLKKQQNIYISDLKKALGE